MIKKLMCASLLCLAGQYSIAQEDTTNVWNSEKSNGGFMEKLSGKIEKKIKDIEKKQNAPVDTKITRSLETISKAWPSNNKIMTYQPYHTSNMLQASNYIYIQLEKNKDGYIGPINTSFFLNEDKTLNEPFEFESYINRMYSSNKWFFEDPFVMEYYRKDQSLYITDNSIVCYEVKDNLSPDVHDIIWIAGKKGKNKTTWAKEIEAYRKFGFDKYEIDQEMLTVAEMANRELYSLENKTIVDLKVVFTDETEKNGAIADGVITFGIEVELSDGTKDKTHNLGGNLYIEDFITDFESTSNIGIDYKTDQWGGHCHCKGATFSISEYSPAPGARDIVQFNVRPKYAGDASQAFTLPIVYKQDISIKSGGMQPKVEVKIIKHSETGEELVYAKEGNYYKKFKVGGTLTCNRNGFLGTDGKMGSHCWEDWCQAGDGWDGTDGGNGGNIVLLTTAAAKNKFIQNLSASGGPGGKAGAGGVAHGDHGTDGQQGSWGNDGMDGTIRVSTGNVSF